MHQIVRVIQRFAVCSGFFVSTGRAYGFRGSAVLTGEVNGIIFCDPSFADIPRWRHEVGHHLALRPLRSVQVGDPVDGRSKRCRVRLIRKFRVILFVLVCLRPRRCLAHALDRNPKWRSVRCPASFDERVRDPVSIREGKQ